MYNLRKFVHSSLRREEMDSLTEARKRLRISTEDLKRQRENEFIKLYNHALRKSPYYSKILKNLSINKINDLKKIPILTKNLLKREYPNILCRSDIEFFVPDSTSGSTGEATLFGIDSRYINKKGACLTRGNELNGFFLHLEKMVTFWGAERDIIDKKDLRYYYNYYIKKIKIISTYHMTEKDIKDNLLFLNVFKPKLVVGYPSALSLMADYLAKNPKILQHKPKGIISAGEMLYDIQRENIEKIFETPVFNRYGCREVGHIASECSAHNGMHYDAERLIIEIIDDKGNICPPNTVGNIVITDLNNYVFPLIRYKIGDMGSLSDDTNCECGCTLPKIDKIEGRSFDIIRGINGNSVSGTFWSLSFKYKVKGIENFQIRQKVINEIEVRMKVNGAFDDIQKEILINLIREKLGDQMIVRILIVDDFEYSPTGKFKWIVSDLNIN